MAIKHADPMKTRTGRTRLGPLNFNQLQTLLDKESRPKEQAKIRNRMACMTPPRVQILETNDHATDPNT